MRVREEIHNLETDFEILGDLDLLYAMAKFSDPAEGCSTLSDRGWKDRDERGAASPSCLPEGRNGSFRSIFRLGDGIKTLIISGANAGGKTVALKTLGLLTLMVQSGIPIPVAEGSQVKVFHEVFARDRR